MHAHKHFKAWKTTCRYIMQIHCSVYLYICCMHCGAQKPHFPWGKRCQRRGQPCKATIKKWSFICFICIIWFICIIRFIFHPSGLQPSLVPRVRELLLHHGHVLPGQLQLQVLQDGGSGSAEYENNLPCSSNPGFEVRGKFCSLIASVPLRKQSDVSV